jgi:hypothetical protein
MTSHLQIKHLRFAWLVLLMAMLGSAFTNGILLWLLIVLISALIIFLLTASNVSSNHHDKQTDN